jgi:hypothetical protein
MPGFASPSFDGLAFIGSLAIVAQFSFRPMTLRRHAFACLVLPFRDLSSAACSRAFPLACILSWSSSVVQSIQRSSPIAYMGSRNRHAVGHSPDFAVFRAKRRLGNSKTQPVLSSTSILLQSISRLTLAGSRGEPQRPSASPGLCFPSTPASATDPLLASLPRSLRSAFRV